MRADIVFVDFGRTNRKREGKKEDNMKYGRTLLTVLGTFSLLLVASVASANEGGR